MNLLFLGGSITDCSHCFEHDNLGFGYVRKVWEGLRPAMPELRVINQGFDGSTLPYVQRTWSRYEPKADLDAVSILVGINDLGVWMHCGYSQEEQTEALHTFSASYRSLLAEVRNAGVIKIMLLEPFIFSEPACYLLWKPPLARISNAIKQIAQENGTVFVPLQAPLDQAVAARGTAAISTDGIHLTEAGHQIVADEWIKGWAGGIYHPYPACGLRAT